MICLPVCILITDQTFSITVTCSKYSLCCFWQKTNTKCLNRRLRSTKIQSFPIFFIMPPITQRKGTSKIIFPQNNESFMISFYVFAYVYFFCPFLKELGPRLWSTFSTKIIRYLNMKLLHNCINSSVYVSRVFRVFFERERCFSSRLKH